MDASGSVNRVVLRWSRLARLCWKYGTPIVVRGVETYCDDFEMYEPETAA